MIHSGKFKKRQHNIHFEKKSADIYEKICLSGIYNHLKLLVFLDLVMSVMFLNK